MGFNTPNTNNSQFAGSPASSGLNFQNKDFAVDSSNAGPKAQGHNKGLPASEQIAKNSNWVATIYSQKVLKYFRTASVVEAITNNDYYGEISNYGDSVNIIKEPRMDIVDYARGEKLKSQSIDSDGMTLVLDQAKAFQFQVDDIEDKLSHVNWQSLATDAASYDLKNNYDKSILNWMAEQVVPANFILPDRAPAGVTGAANGAAALKAIAADGTAAILLATKPDSAKVATMESLDPLDLLNKVNLNLDIAEVPEESRWVVVSPQFLELAMRMDSNLLNRDFNDGAASIKNGLVSVSPIRGLKMYKTNNTPKIVVGATEPGVSAARPVGTSSGKILQDAGNVILAGHISAVATANAIVKTETFRSQDTFADVVRGLHVYGRGVVRPESLVAAPVTYKPLK